LATYPSGKLEKVDLPSITEQIQSQHRRTTPLIFAGINVSMYEDAAPKPKPRWRFSLMGSSLGWTLMLLKPLFVLCIHRVRVPGNGCGCESARV
jgi:hypothetical protein